MHTNIDNTKHILVLRLKTHAFILYRMTLFACAEEFHIYDPFCRRRLQKNVDMALLSFNITQIQQKVMLFSRKSIKQINYLMMHVLSFVCMIIIDTEC